jgi:hypothetical protein
MLSFLLLFRRFYAIMKLGWEDAEFRGLTMFLASWLVLGTVVYALAEGWNPVESLYFCVMTISTIGYGDFTPKSNWMRLYTIIYSVIGIGLFVGFNARVVQFAIKARRDAG